MMDEMILEDIEKIKSDLKGVGFAGKKVLVTGGAGFIGSWLCDVLVNLDAKVVCLDNFSSGLSSNIEHLHEEDKFEFIKHDISQPISFKGKIDVVFHFASRASPLEFGKYPIEILRANTFGTWTALELALKNKASFVLASTSEVYGDPDPKYIPTPETYWGNVNSIGVRSCYDEGKRAAEAFTMAYKKQFGIDVRIVRIHNTYGPRMRKGDVYGRVVTRFIDQAIRGSPLTVFGDGLQTRSFTYVTDMIEGIIKVAYKPGISGEVINLGSGKETSIIDLAKIILDLTGSNSKIEYRQLPKDDPKRRCPDISKAYKLLNWRAETPLNEGLIKTITWMRSHKDDSS
jgi:UDP-glucuronate decarboxylase